MIQEHQELLRQYFMQEYKIEIDSWHVGRRVVTAITDQPLRQRGLWADLSDGTELELADVEADDVDIYKPIRDWTDERNLSNQTKDRSKE